MADIDFLRFKKLLKKQGHFVTKPRMRLFGLLQKRPALSLKELIVLVDKHDQVTVYRNMDLFEQLGIINRVRLGWETKIELSDIFKHHHHHFTCLKCGTISDLPENKTIENEIRKLSKKANMHTTDHQLEIRGLCRVCKNTESR